MLDRSCACVHNRQHRPLDSSFPQVHPAFARGRHPPVEIRALNGAGPPTGSVPFSAVPVTWRHARRRRDLRSRSHGHRRRKRQGVRGGATAQRFGDERAGAVRVADVRHLRPGRRDAAGHAADSSRYSFHTGLVVRGIRDRGENAAKRLASFVQPYARQLFNEHRAAGRLLVLATTSPKEIAEPLGRALGFDDVLATRYGGDAGVLNGSVDGRFVWGRGKRDTVVAWSAREGIDLSKSCAYSDSLFDLPLPRRRSADGSESRSASRGICTLAGMAGAQPRCPSRRGQAGRRRGATNRNRARSARAVRIRPLRLRRRYRRDVTI